MSTFEALARAFAALGYAVKWWYGGPWSHPPPQEGGCIGSCRKCDVAFNAQMRSNLGARKRRDAV